MKYISTHTSLAGRDADEKGQYIHLIISTHTSLAGRDVFELPHPAGVRKFLLTRPSRDVTSHP